MNNIVWLASYPKSGNTWVRIVLQNLIEKSHADFNINELRLGSPTASCRHSFDEVVGMESGELPRDLVRSLRPEVYTWLSDHAGGMEFKKIHDAYTVMPSGEPLIPARATRAVVYILRNPLDVCVSWAHFAGNLDMDRIIRQMNNKEYLGFEGRFCQRDQLPQELLSWSEHVTSWVDAPLPVLAIRYEDMLSEPFKTVSRIVKHIGLQFEEKEISQALKCCSFSNLRAQEEAYGFIERPQKTKFFFRSGKTGSYRDALTKEQISQMIDDHYPTMLRFGYVSESRRLL